MERVKIQIFGDVQGVFFRHYAKKKANTLGLNGWCRNDPDGTVSIVVEGEDEKITEFINWCNEGSPMARVDKVEAERDGYRGAEKGFVIR